MSATDAPDTPRAGDGVSESDSPTGTTPTEVQTFPVLPIPDGVIFPEMVLTVTLQSPEAKRLLNALYMGTTDATTDGSGDKTILLVPKNDGQFASVGVTATIVGRDKLPDGSPMVTLRAHNRAVIKVAVPGRPGPVSNGVLWVEAEVIKEATLDRNQPSNTLALATRYRAAAKALLERVGGARAQGAVPSLDRPGILADSIAYWPELAHEQRIELLETLDIDQRLEMATNWAKSALAEVEMREKIQENVTKGLEDSQKEAILRRQMAAIQDELGDGQGDAVTEFRAKLDELVSNQSITESVAEAIGSEIDRLERTGGESMESNWIRTWLDTVFDIPWAERSPDRIDLTEARSILDADHTALDEVKERLIEYLAVRRLRAERNASDEANQAPTGNAPAGDTPADGPATVDGAPRPRGRRQSGAILALVGPPGVGKTSLGESVASALGRSFVRMALGGIRDEAEIRGHRRTYVGARPGRLVKALTEAGSMNPVVLLDEIDKVSGGWQGDPSAALLEVLDPAQNHSFRDNYLEFELDLSDVVFLATANTLETIPGPLLDRLEVINLDGYTEAEKVTIARDHLLPKLIGGNGLRDGEVDVPDDTLAAVVSRYTREAGVRNLQRRLDKIMRKTAVTISDIESGQSDRDLPITVNVDDLTDLLGKPIPTEDTKDRIDRPGIATGLAVTGAGGDVLFVETALIDGDGDPILTGQLGDVMKESATIVSSLVSMLLAGGQYSAKGSTPPPGVPDGKRLHVHFPAGAVPKDGPSAGITMTTALVSLLTGRQVRSDVAMTGEITLQGKVLPIGGVKQKVLAAHREGIRTVLLPQGNAQDVDDIPDDVRELIDVRLVSTIDEVLAVALEA